MNDHSTELQNILNKLNNISQKINLAEGTLSNPGTSAMTWTHFTMDEMARKVAQNRTYALNIVPYYDAEKAHQIVKCAESWWWQRVRGNISFTYKDGYTFLHDDNGHDNLTDASGNGIIDCSTFVALVLMGYDVEDSPYWNNRGRANISYQRTQLNPSRTKYSWADTQMFQSHILNDADYNGVNSAFKSNWTAAQMAAYYWAAGRVILNFEDARDGDLVFHAKDINYRFKGVSHVSVLCNKKTAYYNVTNTGGIVVRTNISARDDIVFYARPFYEPITTGESQFIDTVSNRVLTPLGNTTSVNGISFSSSGCTITRTSTSAPTSASEPTFFSTGSVGIYLEPGTYSFDTGTKPKNNWSNASYSYYMERLKFNTTVTGVRNLSTSPYTSITGTGNISGTTLEYKGWGGTFTVPTGGALLLSITCYISKTNFAANCPTSWNLVIKRIS